MNIKDIAKISNVSISTVSKVINGKDQDISSETREKVLSVVREYQYIPYAKARKNIEQANRDIGVLVQNSSKPLAAALIKEIEKKAFELGYSVMISNTDNSHEKEKKYLDIYSMKNISGIILIADENNYNEARIKEMKMLKIPLAVIGGHERASASYHIICDYAQETYRAMEYLIKKQHNRIALFLYKSDFYRNNRMIKGYRNALSDYGLRYDKTLIYYDCAEGLLDVGATAVLCSSSSTARKVYDHSLRKGMQIGSDLSVMALLDEENSKDFSPALTSLRYPVKEIASLVLQNMMKMPEGHRQSSQTDKIVLDFLEGDSSHIPINRKHNKIVVVGSMHMDTVLRVHDLPKVGDTLISESRMLYPGGKGANQAVGIGKLMGNVYMIGNLGNDNDGKELYETLNRNNVDTKGVRFIQDAHTGSATIYVADDGDSNIVVYQGAGNLLSPESIRQRASLFENAVYCLLQLEIPMSTVKETMELCREKDIRVILKPSPVQILEDSVLDGLYMLVPNEMELNALFSKSLTIEQQCCLLIDKGVENVIVTLGDRGAYYANSGASCYFETEKFHVVDSTGASDAFISALTFYLARGLEMEKCIKLANYAAGISITRTGVQSSMADRTVMNLYYEKNNF